MRQPSDQQQDQDQDDLSDLSPLSPPSEDIATRERAVKEVNAAFIPGLLPPHSINLMIYSPFSGSTRFLLPQLDNYAAGLPLLGRFPLPGLPKQLGMILCARFEDETRQRIEELALDHLTEQAFPIVKWEAVQKECQNRWERGRDGGGGGGGSDSGRDRFEDQAEFYKLMLEASYDRLTLLAGGRAPRLLIIESIHGMVPPTKLSDPHTIIKFYNDLKEFCHSKDCTILGTVIASKTKQGNHYEDVPHQIYGSVQWAVGTSCLIKLSSYSRKSTVRRVTVFAKAARESIGPLYADFGEYGRLNLCAAPEVYADSKQGRLDGRLDEAGGGTEFGRSEFLDWGSEMDMSIRTVDLWIAAKVASGELVRRGSARAAVFQKPQVN